MIQKKFSGVFSTQMRKACIRPTTTPGWGGLDRAKNSAGQGAVKLGPAVQEKIGTNQDGIGEPACGRDCERDCAGS